MATRTPQDFLTKTLFLAMEKPWGVFFGAEKIPVGLGTRIPYLWGVFWGRIKSPCGNGDTHSLGFPFKNTVFSYVKTLGACFLGHKKAPQAAGASNSQVLSIWQLVFC